MEAGINYPVSSALEVLSPLITQKQKKKKNLAEGCKSGLYFLIYKGRFNIMIYPVKKFNILTSS